MLTLSALIGLGQPDIWFVEEIWYNADFQYEPVKSQVIYRWYKFWDWCRRLSLNL